ncbi:MAG: hypothetical protein PVF54_01215 [Anaerolineae bacterium]
MRGPVNADPESLLGEDSPEVWLIRSIDAEPAGHGVGVAQRIGPTLKAAPSQQDGTDVVELPELRQLLRLSSDV